MSIEIEDSILEKACKEMIETILLCLPAAFKGTIYTIGKPPDLVAKRITSGIISDDRLKISWGLPEKSGYNPPGRPWIEYRDEPGRPLEAMAWCVEKQKSWTAEEPLKDNRSVRLQVEGVREDYHHMEPVLLRKADLNLDMYSISEYPRSYSGDIIWKDSEYVVVAVIKIHFRPQSIKIGSQETKVIKKLSRALGTELLSYKLRQDSMRAMEQISHDRLNACNILADSLRNAITKTGLIFSLVKLEIGHLRSQWEGMILANHNDRNAKAEAVGELNDILMSLGDEFASFRQDLIDVQNRFMELSLPPEKGENWVNMQIEERWRALLELYPQSEKITKSIRKSIEKLKRSLYLGRDPLVLASYNNMPDDLKREWVELIYNNNDSFSSAVLDKLIRILGDPHLNIPSRERSSKSLVQLKALAETMHHLEQNTNFLLNQVLNGGRTSENEAAADEVPPDKSKIES